MVNVTVKYDAGHLSSSKWKQGNLYCINCGNQSVWEEQSEGDYYVGPENLCLVCGATFTHQFSGVKNDGTRDQIMNQIKSHLTNGEADQ